MKQKIFSDIEKLREEFQNTKSELTTQKMNSAHKKNSL